MEIPKIHFEISANFCAVIPKAQNSFIGKGALLLDLRKKKL